MSHAAWDELAAGYAVSALEPEEEHAFLDHLKGCDVCRATLESLREVAGELAYAAEPAEPPADLRARILDSAAAERPAIFGRTPPAQPRQQRAKARRVWQPTFTLATLATAAAVVAVLALGGWNLALRNDLDAKDDAVQRRTAALQCLASESRQFRLTSPSGQAATTCLAGGSAYVVADNIDRNDTGSSVYVLWWMDAKNALHAVERFDVEREGTAVFELPLDVTPTDVVAMAISLEPGRRLPQQPTQRVASGGATSG